MKLDKKDLQILGLLEQDSSLSTQKISKKTHIPITTVHNRIKKLQKIGVIERFTVKINQEKLGNLISAFLMIDVDSSSKSDEIDQKQIIKKLNHLDEVETAYIVTGITDIMAKVNVKGIKELNELILEKIRKIHGLETQTMIILEEK